MKEKQNVNLETKRGDPIDDVRDQFIRNQKDWDRLGESEPYWSVCTMDQYRQKNINEETKAAFYKTGKSLVNQLMEILLDRNVKVNREKALDFGCGVGRITFYLSDVFDYVVGCDVSVKHIELARNRAKLKKVDNIEFQVNGLELSFLGNNSFDFVHTYIVLQHLTPPLIAHYLKQLLKLLNPGGVALIYLPIGRVGYNWNERTFKRSFREGGLQMHCLPKEIVSSIVLKENLELIDFIDKKKNGRPWEAIWDSGYFLIKKN